MEKDASSSATPYILTAKRGAKPSGSRGDSRQARSRPEALLRRGVVSGLESSPTPLHVNGIQ
jgi:hypothetical protein